MVGIKGRIEIEGNFYGDCRTDVGERFYVLCKVLLGNLTSRFTPRMKLIAIRGQTEWSKDVAECTVDELTVFGVNAEVGVFSGNIILIYKVFFKAGTYSVIESNCRFGDCPSCRRRNSGGEGGRCS